jgi:hypothetical protein
MLLRAANAASWPLALLLGVGMLLWLLHALRLAQTLPSTSQRSRLVLALTLVVALALGIFPAPLFAVAGLSSA